MVRGKRAAGKTRAVEELEAERGPGSERTDPLDRLLDRVEPHPPATAPRPRAPQPAPAIPALRMAKVAALAGEKLEITWRGLRAPIAAQLGDGVDREVVAQALKNGDGVLVELDAEGATPVVVGVVQTRIPRALVLKAETVHIEAEREIVLRSNTAALRLREDGDVELVGGRILAASRGLFRLVGRVLRLN